MKSDPASFVARALVPAASTLVSTLGALSTLLKASLLRQPKAGLIPFYKLLTHHTRRRAGRRLRESNCVQPGGRHSRGHAHARRGDGERRAGGRWRLTPCPRRRRYNTDVHRRTFLSTAAGATLIAAEDPPPIPIIDTHIHLFDTTRPQGVPWPTKDNRVLYQPALPERYRKIATPLGIRGAIEVECSTWLEDNQWVLDIAAKDSI